MRSRLVAWLSRVQLRWARRRIDAETRAEIDGHLERLAERYRREGMTPADAAAAARRQFGNVITTREEIHTMNGLPWLESVWQDVRIGVRMLARTPGFTITAILSLALGLGANTAVFSVVSAALFSPLPYRDPGRLVMIWPVPPNDAGQRMQATAPEFLAWQRHATAFDALATEGQLTRELGADEGGAPAETVPAQNLTATMFDVLGVQPSLGRSIGHEHDRVDAPAPVVVISDGLWRRRYNSNPDVIGKTIKMDGQPVTVIGVMPAGFGFWDTRRVDIWAPLAFTRRQIQGVSGRSFVALARLKPGMSLAQAQADLDAIAPAVASDLPSRPKGWTARVQTLDDVLNGPYRRPLLVLQGAVGLVLLIACANVAGLLLARGAQRSAEIALRGAIGAGRGRIIRQLLTESAILALAGTFAGAAIGWAGIHILAPNSGGTIPRLENATMDARVLVFTVVAAIVTALLFGTIPALRGSRFDIVTSLRGLHRGRNDGRVRNRLRRGLVMLQIALAVVLLVCCGLLVRTVSRLTGTSLGADPRDVLTFEVRFSRLLYSTNVGTYAGVPLHEISPVPSRVFDQVWTAMQNMPGVIAASASSQLPFGWGGPLLPFSIEGRPRPDSVDEIQLRQSMGQIDRPAFFATTQIVTPSFFATMGIPLLRGRDFTVHDTVAAPWGVVVNEAMARKFWPDSNPLGESLAIELVPTDRPRQVIGVVGNHRLSPFEVDPVPVMYTLYDQQPPQHRWPWAETRLGMTFLVKTRGNAGEVAPAIRKAIAGIDRNRPISDIHPLEQDVDRQFTSHRFIMSLLGIFAAVAILLAAIGVYGVMAFDMERRTREIGIRMALGARALDIVRLVGGQAGVVLVLGLAVGLTGALFLTRLLQWALWGVTPTDPVTYCAAGILMAAMTAMACVVPARRALRVAPTVALKSE